MLTSDELRTDLAYDPSTGEFVHRKTGNGRRAGDRAGGMSKWGYWVITVRYRQYRAHRLAWLYVHGRWPAQDIDHKNGIPTDNRIDNLRECDDSLNQANRGRPASNTSGHKGVSWNAKSRKWQAGIKRFGKSIHLGLFDDAQTAADAYRRAATEIFQDFARAG